MRKGKQRDRITGLPNLKMIAEYRKKKRGEREDISSEWKKILQEREDRSKWPKL